MSKVKESKTYLGVVEDNKDPKRVGRVKVRVYNVFDSLDVADLPWAKPWKDLNGNGFNIPDIGKVVTVVFESGNEYKPEYIYSDHFNVNLEKKLLELKEPDYLTMKALIFDHKTQIYVNDDEGLKLDHKFNVINIKESTIDVNLKDNFGKINLGTANSTQRAILGDNFLNWFDDFLKILLGDQGGPFLGNLGAPVIATPALISSIQIYLQKKIPKFLSKNVYIVDNENVKKLERIAEGQKGDTWQSTVKPNEATSTEPVNYKAEPGSTNTSFDPPPENANPQASPTAPSTDVGKNPDVAPQTVTENNQVTKPLPQEHPDVATILEILNDKKYKVFTRPFEMNIVAIRNQCLNPGENYTDEFVDFLFVVYKDDTGFWNLRQFNFSTMPGVEFTVTENWMKTNIPGWVQKSEQSTDAYNRFWKNKLGTRITIKEYYKISTNATAAHFSKNLDEFKARQLTAAPNGQRGLTILAPSQYVDVYYIDTKFGAPAMLTIKGAKQMVWYDNDYINLKQFKPFNFKNPDTKGTVNGNFELGIHKAYQGTKLGKKVSNYSYGSQCFCDEESLKEFFELCKKHKDLYGNTFTYTLATKKDWDAAERAVEVDKILVGLDQV